MDCQRAAYHRAILWSLVFLLFGAGLVILDLTDRLGRLSKSLEIQGVPDLPEDRAGAEEAAAARSEVPPPTPAPTSEPTAAPSASATPLPAFLGRLVGRLDDIVMVGAGGVERIVATQDASGAVVIRIHYRNALEVPFRPDVEVAFYGDGLQYLGGLRVSWWHSALAPWEQTETHHRLVVDAEAVRHVAVVRPLLGEEARAPVEGSPYLAPGTWLFDGKQVAWVVEEASPVRVVEEVKPLAQQDKVLVPFEELIAEFHRTWGGWRFVGREAPEIGEGAVALSRAELPEAFNLSWVLVEIQDYPERTGWVKSEQLRGDR